MKNREKAVVIYHRESSCRAMAVAAREKCGAALNTRGFSLVELIFVVTILLVLVAMAVPTFQSYALKAKEYRCIADIHNMGTGIAAYAIDNQNTLPSDLTALSSIGLSNLNDPWGQPYVYYNFLNAGTKYMDITGITPLNTDGYDLYSLGRDGATTKVLSADNTTSSDDIIRASDGYYIGKGENYLAPD